MNKSELALIIDEKDINALINKKFAQWDRIYSHGSSGDFVSDGFILNCIRSDILQLRTKRDRLYAQPMVGQLCLDGGEVPAERELPVQLPLNWMAPASDKARKKALYEKMAKILNEK